MGPSTWMSRENSRGHIKALAMINNKGIRCSSDIYSRDIT